MADPAETIRSSPVDFATAVAYALHPEMRRLILLYVVGALVLPAGLRLLLGPSLTGGPELRLFWGLVGLVVAVAGATFLFAGVVGAVFKLVTDANRLADET